ncbi:hypothetical protein [Haloechinothrix sp. LS1_15]|uniref:hypothetical protein n=1 Tax=Haloechinothrix sp. LS1_15 TaxID=2652248 RepID=UPI002944F577|nr:hypothetical protein [Haloechinothrix sp. LS1_15]MDV6011211.1 hypothetical protein [Haloechinothrix sp. LS1_15]
MTDASHDPESHEANEAADENSPSHAAGRRRWRIGLAATALLTAVVLVTGFVAPGFFLDDEVAGQADGVGTVAQDESEEPGGEDAGDQDTVSDDEGSEDAGTGGDGDVSGGDGARVIEEFVAAINGGEVDVATGMLCEEEDVEQMNRTNIEHAVNESAQIESVSVEEDHATMANAEISGTLTGNEADGSVYSTLVDDSWCVQLFLFL